MTEELKRDTEDAMTKIASPATAEVVGPVGAASGAPPASQPARTDRPQSKGIQVSEQAYPSVDLEGYLSARDRKSGKRVVRDRSGGIALVREDALDLDRFRANGVPLHNVGRRFRVVGEDGITEQERAVFEKVLNLPLTAILKAETRRGLNGQFADRF